MSGSNAISGITLLGAISLLHTVDNVVTVISFVAIVMATINVVGGYVVTDRMLTMFSSKSSKGTK